MSPKSLIIFQKQISKVALAFAFFQNSLLYGSDWPSHCMYVYDQDSVNCSCVVLVELLLVDIEFSATTQCRLLEILPATTLYLILTMKLMAANVQEVPVLVVLNKGEVRHKVFIGPQLREVSICNFD